MFKDNLVSVRKMHGFSQDELAEKIGVSRQTLSKYETGESLPDIERCKLLAEVLDVSLDELVNYDKENSNNRLCSRNNHYCNFWKLIQRILSASSILQAVRNVA